MPLNIAHHKSYHPYNRENIERVRRDEEAAELEAQAKEQKAMAAESEDRLRLLREQHRSNAHDQAGPSSGNGVNRRGRVDESDRAASSGHINFWADLEHSKGPREGSSRDHDALLGRPGSRRTTSAASTAPKERQQDDQFYLAAIEKEGKPWYDDPEMQGPKERKRTEDQRLEHAYKEASLKSSDDPMKAMAQFLAQREEAKRRAELDGEKLADSESTVVGSSSSYKHYVHQGLTREQELREQLEQRRRRTTQLEQDFRERPDTLDPGGTDQDQGLPLEGASEIGTTSLVTDVPTAVETTGIGAMNGVDQATMTPLESGQDTIHPIRPTTSIAETTPTVVAGIEIKNEPGDASFESTSTDAMLTGRFGGRQSMYSVLLGEMIDTVLVHEEYLFSEEDVSILHSYAELPYPARYLFSRLIQRKDTWHRLEALRTSYESEVEDVTSAIDILCDVTGPRFLITHAEAGDDGQEAMLQLLTLEELKTLAKRMNSAKPGTTRASTIAALLTTKSQGTLSSFMAPPSPSRKRAGSSSTSPKKPTQLALNFTPAGKKAAQSVRLAAEVTKLLGSLIRVAPGTRSLIDRVALVFYRGAMLGGTALTTAVLARSRRRNYPEYATERSPRVFATRQHLLQFEEAVATEMEMEEILQWGDGSEATFAKALKLFDTVWPIWQATVAEFDKEHPDGPDRMAYHRMRYHAGWPQTRVVYKGTTILARFKLHAKEEEVLKALLAQRHFRRGKRGEWYDRLALITALYSFPDAKDKIKAKTAALQIAVRGIEDPDTHLIYHDQLQRRIARLENQLPIPKSQKHDFSYAKLKQCTEQTYTGVRLDTMDDGSVLPGGQTLLAPILPRKRSSSGSVTGGTDSPEGSRFQARASLRKIVKVEQAASPAGKYTMKRSGSSSADLLADQSRGSPSPSPSMFDGTEEGASEALLAQYEVTRKESRTSMASVWRGLDGQPCRVETLVLQHYVFDQGYKGFHDEGGILKMLFTLCLWDVLFDAKEGVSDVFETPYQRAPLDLGQDSFAISRGPYLRERLSQISQGEAYNLVSMVDERERPRNTWAIGCRWDSFTREDLLEVVSCIPGPSLAIVFQMMAEEWEHCSGGMPDLLVYRLEDKKVKLCEVKSINDRLSETQKVWIDVLLRAGIQVEVSLVREVEDKERSKSRSKSPVKRSLSSGSLNSSSVMVGRGSPLKQETIKPEPRE